MIVIGIGLVDHHADAFSTEAPRSGVSERLERRGPLVDPATVLGYEILGTNVPPFESWAASDLPALAHKRLGVAVNEDGLVASFDEAARVAEIVSGPDIPSEPLNWRPWLVVQYPGVSVRGGLTSL